MGQTTPLRFAGLLLLGALAFAGCKKSAAPADNTAGVATPAAPMPSTPEARKAAHMPFTTPTVNRHLYPPITDADHDVKAALAEARQTHKRVLLDFGGDWCGDCQVLDIYFHQAPNDKLLADNYIKVNVNIGHQDANLDLAHRYGVPLHGVPALAVLDENGKVVFAQGDQFSDMRYMEPQAVTQFLQQWKPEQWKKS